MNKAKIKSEILRLRSIKATADQKLNKELDKLDNNLENNIITEAQHEQLENKLYIKYNIDKINSTLLNLEREYIKLYKESLINLGKYNNDLKLLFDKAQVNIIVHNKLISKIIN